jgi:hypothetical protein
MTEDLQFHRVLEPLNTWLWKSMGFPSMIYTWWIFYIYVSLTWYPAVEVRIQWLPFGALAPFRATPKHQAKVYTNKYIHTYPCICIYIYAYIPMYIYIYLYILMRLFYPMMNHKLVTLFENTSGSAHWITSREGFLHVASCSYDMSILVFDMYYLYIYTLQLKNHYITIFQPKKCSIAIIYIYYIYI